VSAMNEEKDDNGNDNGDTIFCVSVYGLRVIEYDEAKMITRLLLPMPPPKQVLLAEQSVVLADRRIKSSVLVGIVIEIETMTNGIEGELSGLHTPSWSK
jgi:hypothetical protein